MRNITRYFKVYRECLRSTLIREMEYRLNFIVWGIAMLIEFFINILFFKNLYGDIDSIANWTKYEWFFYLGMVQVLLAIFMIFLFPNLCSLPWSINGGDLDFLLLKPISTQFYVSLKSANFGYFVNTIGGIILMIYGKAHMDIEIKFSHILGAIVYGIVGTILLYSIFMVFNIVSIWTKRADFASSIFFTLWSFMRNPSSVYSSAVRIIFSYVLPIILVYSTPVEILLKKSSVNTMIITLVISIAWFIASIVFWNFAIRHYSSASS